ncbi:MAG TPA: hypothetical protein VN025_05875 [Candidatus Dormibacteraeota bacterium]|nr:hypothetical protein [Candidatus Dormibacteraeota bacterium]
MSLLTILIVAFAVVVALVFMTIIASILAAGIFLLVPRLQETWVSISLWVLAKHAVMVAARELQQRTAGSLETPPQFAVAICVSPLRSPEYLVGLSGRKPIWSRDKTDARIIGDLLATKAWMFTLEERHGYEDVFVCVPPTISEPSGVGCCDPTGGKVPQ